jgi:small GTP-binding protein
VRDFFVDHWDPTIEDAYRKAVDVDATQCQLEILDTAGQDDFESLRPQWMMDKDGYIFVYSMDKEQSLAELNPFFELHEQINERKHVPIVMVANKKDLIVSTLMKKTLCFHP